MLRKNRFTFLTFSFAFCLVKVRQIVQSLVGTERDKAGTRVTLTTIAFATTVDLRSQNRTPGVSLYPAGIAIDRRASSARRAPSVSRLA